MAYTLVPTELIVDGAITSAKLDTNIAISGTLGVTGEVTLATHLIMGDNDKIKIGTGGDLEIYHDGSNSYISNSTGNIYLGDTNGSVHIQAKLNEESIICAADGAVTLYHDNSPKLATSSAGVTVTGTLAATLSTAAQPNITSVGTLTGLTGGTGDLNWDSGTLFVDSSANSVGIGTTSPNKVFSVVGSYENTGFYRDYSGAGIGANYVYIGRKDTNGALVEGVRISGGGDDAVAASHTGYFELAINKSGTFIPLLYSSNGTELVVNESSVDLDFRVESNGNANMLFVDGGNDTVGIGTSSPVAKLDIHMSDSNGDYGRGRDGNLNLENTNTLVTEGGWLSISGYMGNSASGGQYQMGYISGGKQTTAADGDYGGYLTLWTTSGGANGEANSGGYERMRIDSSGNVGIGTSSPNTTLTLSDGTDEFDFGVTANQLLIKSVTSDGSDDQRIIIDAGSGGLSSTRGAYIALSGNEASAEAGHAIYQMGNVTGSAHVFRKAGGSDAVTIDSSGNCMWGVTSVSARPNQGYGVIIAGTGAYGNITTIGNGSHTHFAVVNSGTQVGSITSLGSATAYNTSSDARLKDVTGSARGLEVINELNPVAYNWKADGQADEGLIAQEVLDIVPNAVSGSEEEMYQMDYSKLVVHLVAGMKEQQSIIDDLKSRIETLEG